MTYICQQEEREDIDEGVRQFLVLSQSVPYLGVGLNMTVEVEGISATHLFPPNGEVVFTSWQRWAWARLLKDD